MKPSGQLFGIHGESPGASEILILWHRNDGLRNRWRAQASRLKPASGGKGEMGCGSLLRAGRRAVSSTDVLVSAEPEEPRPLRFRL